MVKLYLGNGRPDCHALMWSTKEMSRQDIALTGIHLTFTFDLEFSRSNCISGMGGPIVMEWKGQELIGCPDVKPGWLKMSAFPSTRLGNCSIAIYINSMNCPPYCCRNVLTNKGYPYRMSRSSFQDDTSALISHTVLCMTSHIHHRWCLAALEQMSHIGRVYIATHIQKLCYHIESRTKCPISQMTILYTFYWMTVFEFTIRFR